MYLPVDIAAILGFEEDCPKLSAELLAKLDAFLATRPRVSLSRIQAGDRSEIETLERLRYIANCNHRLRQVTTVAESGEPESESQSITEIEEKIKKLARTDCSILLLGETGTGKEFHAQKIHRHSHRRGKDMVTINCATLTKGRIDAELYGHVKGAFTDAKQDKPGKIRQAENSTVFLDEIGDLPPDSSGNLLRFLENKEIHPVGGKTRTVDVRILAATNKVDRIRRDVLHRFYDVLYLPPLRDCRKRIPELARQFFYWAKNRPPESPSGQQRRRSSLRFPKRERDNLAEIAYDWPGNIRQLKNAVLKTMHLHDSGRDLTADEVIAAARSFERLA